jgi:hypothetical protein
MSRRWQWQPGETHRMKDEMKAEGLKADSCFVEDR